MLWQIYLSYANIVVNDYAALEDADVIVSSLGNIQLQHNAGEDPLLNSHLLEKPFIRFPRNKKLDFKGILLVISNW